MLERFLFYIDSKRVVNVKCTFWDYKYGWVGNIHGYVFFRKNKVRKLFNEGQIFTLHVEKRCHLFNVVMVLFSIQK